MVVVAVAAAAALAPLCSCCSHLVILPNRLTLAAHRAAPAVVSDRELQVRHDPGSERQEHGVVTSQRQTLW